MLKQSRIEQLAYEKAQLSNSTTSAPNPVQIQLDPNLDLFKEHSKPYNNQIIAMNKLNTTNNTTQTCTNTETWKKTQKHS